MSDEPTYAVRIEFQAVGPGNTLSPVAAPEGLDDNALVTPLERAVYTLLNDYLGRPPNKTEYNASAGLLVQDILAAATAVDGTVALGNLDGILRKRARRRDQPATSR